MAVLEIVMGPDPIFKQQAQTVANVNDEIRTLVVDMFETLYAEEALGIAANMVGRLESILVVDMREDGKKSPIAMINPVITSKSEETQTFPEASLSFPDIRADITRPAMITVEYLDVNGDTQSVTAHEWFAQVVQHEMDYLEGRTFLDHLKPMKRNMLLKKAQKYKKQAEKAQHGSDCPCC